jgi:hypothetical protein
MFLKLNLDERHFSKLINITPIFVFNSSLSKFITYDTVVRTQRVKTEIS